jgi:hypothetical protein
MFALIEYLMPSQGTLTYTQQPAMAIQNMFSVAAQMMHYRLSVWFDTFSESQVASSVTQHAPYRHSGMIAMMVITAVNLLCIVFITIWFLVKARSRKLGNCWQAMTEVSAWSDTRWELDKVNGLTNSEVSHLLVGKDLKIRVGGLAETGLVEILEGVNLPVTRVNSMGRSAWQSSGNIWEGNIWVERVTAFEINFVYL